MMSLSQKILLVEDNPGDADLIKEILSGNQETLYQIRDVDRLSAAVALLQETRFDAVLLDLGLPDSEGIDTVKTISHAFPYLPIVVITGTDDTRLGISALENGAQDYLVKGLIPGAQMSRIVQYAIQRKRADDRVRESEQFLRSSLDGLSAHIAIISDTGNIITVNRAWEQFAEKNGLPPGKKWQGTNYLDACDKAVKDGDETAREFADGIRSVLARTRPSFEMDYACHSRDEERWFHGKVTPFPGETPSHVIIAHENITQRELSSRNLQRSQEKFQGIVDNITVGVVLLNTNSEILEMNQQMRNWYPDISIEDSPRCFDVMDCCCKDAPWTGTCPVYQTITDGQIHKAIHRDKDITYQLLSSPLPDEEGKIASVVLIKENITQRLISEKELRQAQKMEALGTLAGGIAHDFNNILTAILGFSSLIKSGASPESELYDDASEIERAAYRASDLVKQILTFSRQKETELKKIRIDIIIKEALKLLRSTIPTTIDIRTDIQRTQDVILADPTQIHQIIMNLCTNAAHAMEKRGGVLSVSLSTENLTSLADPGLSTEQFVNYLKLVVKDTGHGIPEDTIDSIFDPYFTTKNLGEGTGLGLSVVQGIVETIGGRISVRSEPGLGTEFTIIFPIADRAGSPDRDGGGPGIEGGSENILLIDDEPGVLKVGRRILKSLGYHVTTENDSERAMETIHRNPQRFDLIITDTTMPKIDGIALARMAMKARPDLPVIICTGYSKRISAEKCREMGIRALIQKPLSVAGIASEIRKIFDQGKK